MLWLNYASPDRELAGVPVDKCFSSFIFVVNLGSNTRSQIEGPMGFHRATLTTVGMTLVTDHSERTLLHIMMQCRGIFAGGTGKHV